MFDVCEIFADDYVFLVIFILLESSCSMLFSVWFGFPPTRLKFSELKSICIFCLSREGMSYEKNSMVYSFS